MLSSSRDSRCPVADAPPMPPTCVACGYPPHGSVTEERNCLRASLDAARMEILGLKRAFAVQDALIADLRAKLAGSK